MEVMTQSVELIDMEGSIRLLRRALPRAFPKVAFRVTIQSDDVRVRWVDGPTQREVNWHARLYSGRDFGSICPEDVEHWLTEEGVSVRAEGPDLYVLPPDLVPAGSRRVRFAPRNMWVDRKLSEGFREELAAMLTQCTGQMFDPTSEPRREIPFRGVVLRGSGAQLIWQASCYVRRELETK